MSSLLLHSTWKDLTSAAYIVLLRTQGNEDKLNMELSKLYKGNFPWLTKIMQRVIGEGCMHEDVRVVARDN